MNLLVLILGGALGAGLRSAASDAFDRKDFYAGTLAVNLLACAILIVLFKIDMPNELRMALSGGFAGSLSTFSALAWQIADMLKHGRIKPAACHIALNCLGIAILLVV